MDDEPGTRTPAADRLSTMESDDAALAEPPATFAPSAAAEPWLDTLLTDSQALEDMAIDRGDVEAVESIHAMVIALLQVRQLQNYFHRSPSRSIQGPGGVAEQLNLTRNAVYKRLEALGLEVKHFRVPMHFGELIQSSSLIPGMISKVKNLIETYPQGTSVRKPR
ncbi:hypothetical protein VT03_19240 [Planctomyces sp. SH-PL14]|nr:hypothetical protein VT03_19240 [Planctomyces sp. SH-PL14]